MAGIRGQRTHSCHQLFFRMSPRPFLWFTIIGCWPQVLEPQIKDSLLTEGSYTQSSNGLIFPKILCYPSHEKSRLNEEGRFGVGTPGKGIQAPEVAASGNIHAIKRGFLFQ
jgi:hypothetical protein